MPNPWAVIATALAARVETKSEIASVHGHPRSSETRVIRTTLRRVGSSTGLFTLSTVLAALCLASGLIGSGISPSVSALLGIGGLALYAFVWFSRFNSVDPLLWIPAMMVLFYFGMPVAEWLFPSGSQVTYDSWGLKPDPRDVSSGFAVASLTLVSFIAGASIHGIERPETRPDFPQNQFLSVSGASVAALGLAMLALGIAIAGPSSLFSNYGALKEAEAWGAVDARFVHVGALFSIIGVLAALSGAGRARWAIVLAVIALGSVSAVYFLLGDRSAIMAMAVAVSWVYTIRVKRIGWPIAFVAFGLALVVAPLLAEYRVFKDVVHTSNLSIVELVRASFYETGSSAQVFVHTLANIPETKGYDWGVSVVYAIAELIPNLGLNPAGQRLLDPLQHQPSIWLVHSINPIKYFDGGGYGFALGAEWYFNFGVPGVWIGCLATGWLTARVRRWSLSGGLALVVSAQFASMVALLVRNSLSAPLRGFVWSAIALCGVYFALRLFAAKPVSDPTLIGQESGS